MPSAQHTSTNANKSEQLNLGSSNAGNSNNQVSGNKTPQDQPDFIKQSLSVVEKKVRNLEKRRIKLDEYKQLQSKGQELNADQLSAVEKYEEVKVCIELMKDVEKQLLSIGSEAIKLQKKQAKRDQIERDELFKERQKEIQKIHSLLTVLGQEEVKEDFKTGKNNAIALTDEEFTLLDEFYRLAFENEYKMSTEFENAINDSVDHLFNLIESKNKPILNSTYSDVKKLLDKISQSQYWLKTSEKPADSTETDQQQSTELPSNDIPTEQNVKYQHNTSTDDFVIVTTQEVETNSIEQQQFEQQQQQQQQQQQLAFLQQQQQQQQPPADQRTFFSTLNPDNNAGYIQEVINSNTEINFLQDSEIQQQPTHDLQHSQNTHHAYQQPPPQQNFGNNDYGMPQNDDFGGQYQNTGFHNNQNMNPDNMGRKGPYQPRNGNYRGGNRGGPRGGGGYRGGPRGGGQNSGPRGGNYEKRGHFKPNRGGPSGGHYNNRPQQEAMN